MSENEKHSEKMKRLKTSKQKILEKKTVKKGLIIIHTGLQDVFYIFLQYYKTCV